MDIYQTDHGFPFLNLSRQGSFDPRAYNWGVYAADEGRYLLHRDDDVEAELPAGVVAKIRAELAGIVLPPFPDYDIHGCDGEGYRVIYRRGMQATDFSWWSSYPDDWAPLMAFHERTAERFDEYLARRI